MTQQQYNLGQYMTTPLVAQKMCNLVKAPVSTWQVLDPACGDGNLLMAAAECMVGEGVEHVTSRLIGFDIDPRMVSEAKRRLAALLTVSPEEIKVFQADFLEVATKPLAWTLFSAVEPNVILSNPPYGKQRELKFFESCYKAFGKSTELVFLMPLSFLDNVGGVSVQPLKGRPLKVTTGHAIVTHRIGEPYRVRPQKGLQSNSSPFKVLSGIKLYEKGAGEPPQSDHVLATKPYSSTVYKPGWWPCVRTGDIGQNTITIGRLWVHYGAHLAHPKDEYRFTGPRLFVRRVPLWSPRRLAAVFCNEKVICAGDVLVVKHLTDSPLLLKGLAIFLNSTSAMKHIFEHRPSVQHRDSYPKISVKDLNFLLENFLPSEKELLDLGARGVSGRELSIVAGNELA